MFVTRLAVVVALLALAGCNGDPEPAAEEPSSPVAEGVDPLAPPPGPKAKQRRKRPSQPAPRTMPFLIEEPPSAEEADAEATGERKIDLMLKDVELGEALEMLGQLAGVRIEVTQPLAKPQTVTLTLKGEPWRRALERVLAAAGEFQLRGQGDVLSVTPRSTVVAGTVSARDASSLTVRRDGDVPSTVRLVLPEGVEGSDAAATAAAVKPLFDSLQVGVRVVARCQLVGQDLVVTSLASRQ